MTTFAKLNAPHNCRGKARIQYKGNWRKIDPDDRLATLNQWMRLLREEHAKAERESRSKRKHEDAVWAAQIQARV